MRKVLFYTALLLALAGCGIFGLRESQDPSDPPLWNNTPSTWEQALQNLSYSYTDSRNVVRYASLLLPAFRFHFAAQDVVDYSLPSSWARAEELDMLFNLHSLAKEITLELQGIPGSNDEILLAEARVFRSYDITLRTASATRLYSGSFEIQLRKESGYWYILNWYDYRSAGDAGWGKLKYDYSQ